MYEHSGTSVVRNRRNRAVNNKEKLELWTIWFIKIYMLLKEIAFSQFYIRKNIVDIYFSNVKKKFLNIPVKIK